MLTSVDFTTATSFVTGAGGGMGQAIAESLARRGGAVVVTDIELDAAARVADKISAAGGRAVARQLDVADADAVKNAADFTYDTFGQVDILVNNAGVTMRPFRAVWDASLSDFHWMMGINYFGIVNGLHAFVPRMRADSGRKHIVNTSSMATLDEVPGHGMYTASKGAVDGISEVLRGEFEDQGDNIGVTILYPGQVTTRIATSERLRDAADRSDARGVLPYERKRPVVAHNAAIGPEPVGEMVIAAIEHNDPYCLTHPAPMETLRRRLAAWEAGYRGIPQNF
jgi:NAD(P)-dependent dehydrogenase (short-subunit alcohol dehydrogenase family)